MTRIALATMLLFGLPLAVTGCDKTMIDDVPFITYDLAGTAADGASTFIPGKPLIGMLIDRVGRPGVNLALTDPFNLVTGKTTDAVKDLYNATTSGNWGSYAARPYIAENLAVFDGLDGTCGNQVLASQTLSSNRYITLGNALADDRLYINGNLGVCMNYLAVEVGMAGTDCGGYHPTDNAMDVTYNYLISGSRTGTFTNGINGDLDGGIAYNAPFPFLTKPN